MPQSTIVYGASPVYRALEIKKMVSGVEGREMAKFVETGHPDIIVISTPSDRKSIGISESRKVVAFLKDKPFSLKNRFVIIFEANNLTSEAQNALLKTLEEPPSFAHIFLETKSKDDLLSTVLSRCRKHEVKGYAKTPTGKHLFSGFMGLDLVSNIDAIEEIAKEEREDIVKNLEFFIDELRTDKTKNGKAIKTVFEIKSDIENTNVNARLALEIMAIRISKL